MKLKSRKMLVPTIGCISLCFACSEDNTSSNRSTCTSSALNSNFASLERFLANLNHNTSNLNSVLFNVSNLQPEHIGAEFLRKFSSVRGSKLNLTSNNQELIWLQKEKIAFTGGLYVVNNTALFKGLPIINVQLKTQETEKGEMLYAAGEVPAFLMENDVTSSNLDVLNFNLTKTEIINKISDDFQLKASDISRSEKVWFANSESLEAAYAITIAGSNSKFGVPYKIIMSAFSGLILKQIPLSLQATGKTSIYPENKVATPTLTEVTLTDLSATGAVLSGDYIKVLNCNKKEPSINCLQTAVGPDYSGYKFEDAAYDEVMGYYAITTAMNWHKKMLNMQGIDSSKFSIEWGSKKSTLGLGGTNLLKIYVRAITKNDDNTDNLENAQYLTGGLSGVESPIILVGTGYDGGDFGAKRWVLKYLGKDADVYMHEFGHHILYRSLQDIQPKSQTLFIHEGASDYFTYAITGNNKLGESIYIPGTSLRSGNLIGVYNDYKDSAPHKIGEFWSSVLWDIRVAMGQNANNEYRADKIIWDAVDLMKSNADFPNMIEAMTKSTEIYAGIYKESYLDLVDKLYNVLYLRGFTSSPPNHTTTLPAVSITGGSGTSSSSTNTTGSCVP